MTSLDELVANLTRAGASKQQIAQETANWHKAQEVLKKPRHERALPSAAFSRSKRARSKEAVEFWSTPVAERKAEPTLADLRKEVQASHPDHGGTAEKFIAAKKRLDKARGKK